MIFACKRGTAGGWLPLFGDPIRQFLGNSLADLLPRHRVNARLLLLIMIITFILNTEFKCDVTQALPPDSTHRKAIVLRHLPRGANPGSSGEPLMRGRSSVLIVSSAFALLVGESRVAYAQQSADDSKRLDEVARELARLKEQLAALERGSAASKAAPAPAGGAETEADPLPGSLLGGRASGWTLGGYGEMLVTTRLFGPDPNREYDASKYRETHVDLARVVIVMGYDFTRWLSLHTELEVEHGGTGATLEQEWDEFGEFEKEIEKGGEIVLEQAYLEARFGREFGLPCDVGPDVPEPPDDTAADADNTSVTVTGALTEMPSVTRYVNVSVPVTTVENT